MPPQATCYIWISRSWAGSCGRRTVSPEIAATRWMARAGSTCMWPSTTTRVSPSRPFIRMRSRLRGAWVICAARHLLQSHTHRQRRGLSLACLRSSLPHAWHQAPLHPALHPAHQRQGRALHADGAPGMGLCRRYQNSNQRIQELRPWLHQYN